MKVMVGSSQVRTISGKHITREKWEKVNKVEKRTRSKETHCVWASNDTLSQSFIPHHFLCSSCIPRVSKKILLGSHFILFTTYADKQTKEKLTTEWIKSKKIKRFDHTLSWLARESRTRDGVLTTANHITKKKLPFSLDDEEITGRKRMNVCKSEKRKIFGHKKKHRKECLERKYTKRLKQDPNPLQCSYHLNKIQK